MIQKIHTPEANEETKTIKDANAIKIFFHELITGNQLKKLDQIRSNHCVLFDRPFIAYDDPCQIFLYGLWGAIGLGGRNIILAQSRKR